MRLRFNRLKGMEVVADREGRLLGSVRKLQLDSKHKVAVGLVFKNRALSGEHWAKVTAISRVGEDIVFLADAKTVREDAPPGRDVRDMLGLSVTSLDGKRLGALEDVVIDTEDWRLACLVLDNGGEVDIDEEAVLGEDTILLRRGAGDAMRSSSGHAGFFSRLLHSEQPQPETWQAPKPKPKRRGKREP